MAEVSLPVSKTELKKYLNATIKASVYESLLNSIVHFQDTDPGTARLIEGTIQRMEDLDD